MSDREDRLAAQKLRVEEWFARQMGMTVPQWREAQLSCGAVRRKKSDRVPGCDYAYRVPFIPYSG